MTQSTDIRLLTEAKFNTGQSAQDGRLSLLEGAAGFTAPPLGFQDSVVKALVDNTNSNTTKAIAAQFTKKGELMINVKDYGAVGNGTVDDTVAVQNAVAYAKLYGQVLFWPNGGYKTTANIPDLHAVRHRGNGYIIRNSGNFFPEPKSTGVNSLYVSPTGVSTNDGLSAAEPKDVQSAIDALSNYGPVLNGRWYIIHADGTYPGGYGIPAIMSRRKIEFVGTTVGNRVAPTVNYVRGTQEISWAIYLGPRNSVRFSHIGFIGWNNAVLNAGGIRTAEHNEVEVWNCRFENCEIGLFVLDFTLYNFGSCYFLNCGYAGIHELYSVVRNSMALTEADRTVIENCQFGIKSKELNTGHMDRTEFLGCTWAIHLSRSCTMNFSYSTFKRNGTVLVAGANSAFVDLYCTFGTGVDKNTVKYRFLQGTANVAKAATENALSAPYVGQSEKSLAYGRMAVKHQNTLTDTNIVPLGLFNPGEFQGEGSWIKWESYGSANITVPATMRLRVGGQGVVVITMPIGVYNFKFEGRMYVTANGDTQRADGIMFWNNTGAGTSGNVMGGGNRTVPIGTVSTDSVMGIFVTLGALPDSVQIDQAVMLTSDL